MNLFDLHCDTPYRCYTEKAGLFENDFHVSIKSAEYLNRWIQCMAVWMPDELRGEDAVEFSKSDTHAPNTHPNRHRNDRRQCFYFDRRGWLCFGR